jgi:hypothetical protein
MPLFVGAVKEWSCCGQRGATFADFSALKGCVRPLGRHRARVTPWLTRVALHSCAHDEHTQGQEEVGPTQREVATARRRAAEHHLFSDP